jgi:hypothetical protein
LQEPARRVFHAGQPITQVVVEQDRPVRIRERKRDPHLAAHRGIAGLKLHHFDHLLIGYKLDEVAVVGEPISNTLLVSANPRYFEQIRAIIEELDKPQPQVLIQVLLGVLLVTAFAVGVKLRPSTVTAKPSVTSIESATPTAEPSATSRASRNAGPEGVSRSAVPTPAAPPSR